MRIDVGCGQTSVRPLWTTKSLFGGDALITLGELLFVEVAVRGVEGYHLAKVFGDIMTGRA
jgi:hypothetical protein